jgi:hypothetical protein
VHAAPRLCQLPQEAREARASSPVQITREVSDYIFRLETTPKYAKHQRKR